MACSYRSIINQHIPLIQYMVSKTIIYTREHKMHIIYIVKLTLQSRAVSLRETTLDYPIYTPKRCTKEL